jgi:chaperonin cofactor prefoldin
MEELKKQIEKLEERIKALENNERRYRERINQLVNDNNGRIGNPNRNYEQLSSV